MSGNNKKALQIIRIQFPLFDDSSISMIPGQKYYFPEHPEIDNKTVVGMEVHSSGAGGSSGEPDLVNSREPILDPGQLAQLYVNFYNNKNECIFENVPALFLYNKFSSSPTVQYKLSIQPLTGKLKTRSCYVQLPGNFPSVIARRWFSITFYLR